LWRWSRALAARSAATNERPTAPRHAASSYDSWLTLTPRSDLRAEPRHGARGLFSTTLTARSGSAFPLKTGSEFLAGPNLLPFYEHLGWRGSPGDLMVTQKQATVPFTFNLPMTTPLRMRESLDGVIDLQGPPW